MNENAWIASEVLENNKVRFYSRFIRCHMPHILTTFHFCLDILLHWCSWPKYSNPYLPCPQIRPKTPRGWGTFSETVLHYPPSVNDDGNICIGITMRRFQIHASFRCEFIHFLQGRLVTLYGNPYPKGSLIKLGLDRIENPMRDVPYSPTMV